MASGQLSGLAARGTSKRRLVRDVISACYRVSIDEPFVKELDFSTLERVNSTFVSEEFARRESDVIWKLSFRGRPIYLARKSRQRAFSRVGGRSAMTIEDTTRLLKWRAEWASAQPYPMVTPVFPGVTEWAAIVLVAFAVMLIAAAIFPRRT